MTSKPKPLNLNIKTTLDIPFNPSSIPQNIPLQTNPNINMAINPSTNSSKQKKNRSITLPPENESSISKYEFENTIGQGNFGKVKLATNKQTHEKVAIKILNKSRIESMHEMHLVHRELSIIRNFHHINVVKVYQIIEDKLNFYIIMEYCEHGELFDYIVSKKRLSERESLIFFHQLINGVEYIHDNNIVHRDLKPENLLLDSKKILKIIDFGLSARCNKGEMLTTKCGSPSYAAPEIIKGKEYDGYKTDIWCCGIILFAMCCGYLPFEGDENGNGELFLNILKGDIEFPEFISDESREMITLLLNSDPERRIRLEQIKESRYYLTGKKLCTKEYNDVIKEYAHMNRTGLNFYNKELRKNSLGDEDNNSSKEGTGYKKNCRINNIKIINSNSDVNAFRKKIKNIGERTKKNGVGVSKISEILQTESFKPNFHGMKIITNFLDKKEKKNEDISKNVNNTNINSNTSNTNQINKISSTNANNKSKLINLVTYINTNSNNSKSITKTNTINTINTQANKNNYNQSQINNSNNTKSNASIRHNYKSQNKIVDHTTTNFNSNNNLNMNINTEANKNEHNKNDIQYIYTCSNEKRSKNLIFKRCKPKFSLRQLIEAKCGKIEVPYMNILKTQINQSGNSGNVNSNNNLFTNYNNCKSNVRDLNKRQGKSEEKQLQNANSNTIINSAHNINNLNYTNSNIKNIKTGARSNKNLCKKLTENSIGKINMNICNTTKNINLNNASKNSKNNTIKALNSSKNRIYTTSSNINRYKTNKIKQQSPLEKKINYISHNKSNKNKIKSKDKISNTFSIAFTEGFMDFKEKLNNNMNINLNQNKVNKNFPKQPYSSANRNLTSNKNNNDEKGKSKVNCGCYNNKNININNIIILSPGCNNKEKRFIMETAGNNNLNSNGLCGNFNYIYTQGNASNKREVNKNNYVSSHKNIGINSVGDKNNKGSSGTNKSCSSNKCKGFIHNRIISNRIPEKLPKLIEHY